MKMFLRVSLFLVLSLPLMSIPASAVSISYVASQRLQLAANKNDQSNRNNEARISSAQAASIARSATGGKVLSVKPSQTAYKVKILKKNGVVSSVSVDKRSGQLKGR